MQLLMSPVALPLKRFPLSIIIVQEDIARVLLHLPVMSAPLLHVFDRLFLQPIRVFVGFPPPK